MSYIHAQKTLLINIEEKCCNIKKKLFSRFSGLTCALKFIPK